MARTEGFLCERILALSTPAVLASTRNPGGLLWGLFQPVPAFAFQIKVFFLLRVIIAGAYGAYSVSRRILFVQAAPAALALIMLYLA